MKSEGKGGVKLLVLVVVVSMSSTGRGKTRSFSNRKTERNGRNDVDKVMERFRRWLFPVLIVRSCFNKDLWRKWHLIIIILIFARMVVVVVVHLRYDHNYNYCPSIIRIIIVRFLLLD